MQLKLYIVITLLIAALTAHQVVLFKCSDDNKQPEAAFQVQP